MPTVRSFSPRHRRPLAAVSMAVVLGWGIVPTHAAETGANSPAAAAREARIARQLASTPDARPSLADWSAGLPPFDIRCAPDGRPGPDALASIAAWRETRAWAARHADAAAVIDALPETRIDDHPLFGTPWFVRSTRALLTPAAPKRAPDDIVASYVHDHAALFEIDALEIPAARLARNFRTDHNGVTHLTFQQQCRGLDLFGCQVRANVTADGRLINIASTMLPRPAPDFAAPEHTLSPAQAVVAAARAAGVTLDAPPAPAGPSLGLSQRTEFRNVAGLRDDEPAAAERIFFPLTREIVRAAYHVVIPVPGMGHTYEIIIDATDGALLARDNRLVHQSTQPVTMRVYTSDGVAPFSPSHRSPSTVQAGVVARELVTINPADVTAYSPGGWINDFDTQTMGNNIDAHLDHDANNVADTPRPDGGPARVFDFPLDPGQPPITYAAAAVTQVFYLGNVFHDRLYALGFNEAAGNFQNVNFSGQGFGNDRLLVDVQEGLATSNPPYNNANFSGSGGDGTPARVQMYVFNGADPDRDSSVAADIVYHEFAHGLSIRLLGGVPFTANQTRSLGEGWSDYFAFALLAEPGDDPHANYAFSPYLTYQFNSPSFNTNFYFGLRRYPYSTNFLVNPLTFADIDDSQFAVPPVPTSPAGQGQASEEHNAGEVWCNTLMDCRARLWDRDGFSGNERMMRLVVDGLKLSPPAPTFVQCRDAIIQADLVNSGGADRVPLWTGFARRGLGHRAFAANGSTNSGIVESFTAPFIARFEYPDGVPQRLDAGRPTAFRVRLRADELTFTRDTQRLVYTVNDGPEITRALTPTQGDYEFIASLPAFSCFDRVRFSIRTGTDFGDYADPPSGEHSAIVFDAQATAIDDPFETDTGWIGGPDTALTGRWVRVDPIASPAQPGDDHTPGAGVTCWVTGQGSVGGAIGEADVDGGATILTSPAFDLSAAAGATVSYWRWYVNSGAGISYEDVFRVQVSTDDGAHWTAAETLGPGSVTDPDTNGGWRFARWTLADVGLSPTARVRVRFIAEDAGAGSAIEAAIDDFRIDTLTCDPRPPCVGDFNRSGQITIQDVFDFLAAYLPGLPAADINGADGVTPEDVFGFLASYFAGCP